MKTIICALAVAGLAITPVAQAGESFQIDFKYDASDLNTTDGASAVYKRLQKDIRRACGADNSHRGLAAERMTKACVETTTEDAIKQINSEPLSVAHYGVSTEQVG